MVFAVSKKILTDERQNGLPKIKSKTDFEISVVTSAKNFGSHSDYDQRTLKNVHF